MTDKPLKKQVIADHLRQLITDGVIGPGEKLPSGASLAEEYKVARPTVKEAYKELVDSGLVVYMGRSGYFVRSDRKRRWVLAKDGSYADPWQEAARGQTAVWQQVRVEIVTGQARVRGRQLADWLGYDPDEAVCRVTVRSIGGDPLALVATYIPASIADGTPLRRPEPLDEDVVAYLAERAGLSLSVFADVVGVRVATDHEISQLRITEGYEVAEAVRVLAFGNERKPLVVDHFVVAAGAEFWHELNAT